MLSCIPKKFDLMFMMSVAKTCIGTLMIFHFDTLVRQRWRSWSWRWVCKGRRTKLHDSLYTAEGRSRLHSCSYRGERSFKAERSCVGQKRGHVGRVQNPGVVSGSRPPSAPLTTRRPCVSIPAQTQHSTNAKYKSVYVL